ncbi:MAG: hypothetical protein PHN69_07780 [Candidatus Pacebacteria bacterium]|nr:hypothetical protein [Candidatus Paceibacterota bacterium]
MKRVLILEGCFKCWYRVWGKCMYPDMDKVVCPPSGFAKNCPLPTKEELYEAVKTDKYYEDNDW